jgi:hypothetical protein
MQALRILEKGVFTMRRLYLNMMKPRTNRNIPTMHPIAAYTCSFATPSDERTSKMDVTA